MTKSVANLGLNPEVALHLLDVNKDIEIVHPWFQMEYAAFWNMQNMSVEETRKFYSNAQENNLMEVYLGHYKNRPSFVMECYLPEYDDVGRLYPVEPGDIGMHFIVGPSEISIPNFTRDVLRQIMAFLFYTKKAKRVVVEPDVRNSKVHKLNTYVGFHYSGTIELKEKRAYLGFCSKKNFLDTLKVFTNEPI